MKTLAIIPARGGSKGIKGKNIKLLHGKPLIAYTIELALNCKFIDKVIVSTDDEKIGEVSIKYGAEVPFQRPAKYATDYSPTIDTIRHAVNFLENKGEKYDNILILEPTSPLRIRKDIIRTMNKLNEKNVDTVVTACKHSINFSDVLVLKSKGFVKPYKKVKKLTFRRQDSENNLLLLNGAVYAIKRDILMNPKVKMLSPYGENEFLRTKVVIMPEMRSIEIDTHKDFDTVRYLMRLIK